MAGNTEAALVPLLGGNINFNSIEVSNTPTTADNPAANSTLTTTYQYVRCILLPPITPGSYYTSVNNGTLPSQYGNNIYLFTIPCMFSYAPLTYGTANVEIKYSKAVANKEGNYELTPLSFVLSSAAITKPDGQGGIVNYGFKSFEVNTINTSGMTLGQGRIDVNSPKYILKGGTVYYVPYPA